MTDWRGFFLVCVCFCAATRATNKMDYLQPYKFVKPLDDLGLYGLNAGDSLGQASLENEELAVAERRLGKPASTDDYDDDTEETTAEPEPEPESEPEPEKRSRTKSRYSQRKGEADDLEEEIFDDDDEIDDYNDDENGPIDRIDRMSNHKTEVYVDDTPAESRKLVRLPAHPGDEYYYYYDDDYYYDDYLPILPPPVQKKPPTTQRVQNKPRQNLRPPAPRPAAVQEKPRSPPKKKTEVRPKKKEVRPKQKKPSRRKPAPASRLSAAANTRRQYSIQSTINRLKGLKDNQIKRQGKPSPSLPDPWKELKLPPLPKLSLPSLKLKQNFPFQLAAPSKKVAKVPAYYDDYYYDYQPLRPVQPKPQKNRRQGTGVLGGANPLALLVAPLAGIALLTAAAAVAINPVLVTVSLTGKRRKRSADGSEEEDDDDFGSKYNLDEGISPELEEKIHEMQVLEKFMSSVPENLNYQHQVLSMYLSCSGYTEVTNKCIDRVVCEYADSSSEISSEERDVISIVLYNIMTNEFVIEEYKDRLRDAAKQGRSSQECKVYECEELSRIEENTLRK